ncbi:MAG: hypothetical protein NHF89_01090 [Candidatus Shikimatogenerans bostrichidophilus]|nr:MAG: hypothetical protein NHF89_01090 [Candidatus Shikimatogenerans bostrichidophilus]
MNIEDLKLKCKNNTLVFNIKTLEKITNTNIYKIINILAKRSNQINDFLKLELDIKLKKFYSSNEELYEFFENKEQIEISKFFEKLPKPSLISIFELLNGDIIYYNDNDI